MRQTWVQSLVGLNGSDGHHGDDQAYFEQQFDQKKCIVCDLYVAKSSNHIKCADCGSNVYTLAAENVSKQFNGICNPFHKPMEWMVSLFYDGLSKSKCQTCLHF